MNNKWVAIQDLGEQGVITIPIGGPLSPIPKGAYGFVYKITNLDNGKFYVGKKNLQTVRNVPKGKKELAAMTDKRGSKKKRVVKESNWRTYNSSCKPLLEDIANGASIKKQILEFASCKGSLTYKEAKWQFCEGVLENDSYNENILGKFYSKTINCGKTFKAV